MDISKIKVDRPVKTVAAVWSGDLRCPLCGDRLRYAYPGVLRRVEDLTEVIMLRVHYYLCDNVHCSLHKPFRAPQDIVLPYKQYSRAVHELLIRIYYEVGNNPRQIQQTLAIFTTVVPSLQSIRRYLDDFLFLQSDQVDDVVKHKMQRSSGMILVMDGQRPKRNSPALWNFHDLLTDEQVHAEYLKKADFYTLGTILQKIERKYGVPILAVISDHQKSIVKAVKHYFPHVHHQFCHFHFLQNLSRPLAQMDSHLHAEIAQAINNLYINKTSRVDSIQITPHILQAVQDFFAPINRDLQSLVQRTSRSFDVWGGIESFEALARYIGTLQQTLLPSISVSSRVGKILLRTIAVLKQVIVDQGTLYAKLRLLLLFFDHVREILGIQCYTKVGMQGETDAWNDQIRREAEKWNPTANFDAPITILSYRASISDVLIQWSRLYENHRDGLFEYLEDPRLLRTTTSMERQFSREVGFWRGLVGKGRVDYYVQIQGDLWLKTFVHYTASEIQSVLNTYSVQKHKNAQILFTTRRKNERDTWNRSRIRFEGIKEMKKRLIPRSRKGQFCRPR